MRILLDTNILIAREDHKELDQVVMEFQNLVHQHKISICIHPDSIKDITRDKDENRRKILLTKIKSYSLLESPPDFQLDIDFKSKIGEYLKQNTLIDNQILFSLYKNSVDYLVTEDSGLRRKGSRFDLSERIFSISEVTAYLKRLYIEPDISAPYEIELVPMYNLYVQDSFFDDLRNDYENFDDWFKEKSKEGRKVWVYFYPNKKIGAFCAWKEESEEIACIPPLPKKKRIKIATLKVDHQGYKIGELFLKMAFQYAIEKQINELYLTHYEKGDDRLVELIEDFGFTKIGSKETGEFIYLKELIPPQDRRQPDLIKPYYPALFCGEGVNKYFVPIRPEYHRKLFPEFEKLLSLGDAQGLLFDPVIKMQTEGNTIKKAYLCHANIKKIQPNDILLFYRSKDIQSITSIGVVEKVYINQRSADEVLNLVSKRTVYSYEEIQQLVQTDVLVLIFRWHFYFKKPIESKELKQYKIFLAMPQSIAEIDHVNFQQILKIGGVDERFIFN